ncbi:MopE-related protein [Polyangium sp. y55x31]|uniref:MopE-related protein n=1 Tax=Polyangium sp. y55x31 TaxID=3042688 RepID=UPI002482BABA|nr:MopE-related protein [Polyangium sp. y55x31]MDI1481161.1 MopE-related protein [Polyangium sp. y55x31]
MGTFDSRRRRGRSIALLFALAATTLSAAATAQTFPAAATWAPLTRFDAGSGTHLPIGDVSGDATGARDIVGNTANPVSYVHADGTHFYFRLRVNTTALAAPTNFDNSSSFGCVIDADADATDFEFSAIVDGISAPDAVRFWVNTTQQTPGSPADTPEVMVKAYLGPLQVGQPGFGYARQVAAGSVFPIAAPDADFFVDWAVEKSLLQAAGVGDGTPLRFACGTGVSTSTLSTDFTSTASLALVLSDPYLCGGSGCIPQTCAGYGQLCSDGIGACATSGSLYCNAAGQAVCDAFPGEPSDETCNAVDDNCDGVVDDGNPEGGGACTTGLAGVCGAGTENCLSGVVQCTPNVAPGSTPETCNSLDDDCDGQTDEGFALGTSCTVGLGVCAASGVTICNGQGGATCSATPGTPQTETCNGLDDDCNGFADDGDPGGGQPCATGLDGACSVGITACSSGGVACVPAVLPGELPETCNFADDDCDGLEDEDLGLGAACVAGLGACAVLGSVVCTPEGGTACNAVAGTPSTEICGNTIDEDCDGVLDNGCPDTDGDGLIDAIEEKIGTDPADADTDDDGAADGSEINGAVDTDGDGLINALDPDSDDDGLFDGTELGKDCSGPGTDAAAGHCRPDKDGGLTKTDPLDPDTDGGGVNDGSEDTNLDGVVDPNETDPTASHAADDGQTQDTDGDGLSDGLEKTIGTNPNDLDSDDDGLLDGDEANPSDDTDGDGLINTLDPDSDDDALFDGTEAGKNCSHPSTNPVAQNCRPDMDGGNLQTSPVARDTDGGGVRDGAEDRNLNGRTDLNETDPTEGNAPDDQQLANLDNDGDGLTNQLEVFLGSNPNDADSDDDGVLDGDEANPSDDTDGDGKINVRDPDSDGDGLFDGTEVGNDCSHPSTNPAANACLADADLGATRTSMVDPDSDDGGVSDGDEDKNKDGKLDPGETNPVKGNGEDDPLDSDGDGLLDKLELMLGTDPFDWDSDDDGVSDAEEPNLGEDTDGDGFMNALDPDSDNDGLPDGLEMGKGCDNPDTDPSAGQCIPDGDGGATKTDPLDWDTDDGGASDGAEDKDKDGVIDPGETDPTVGHGADDPPDTDGDGIFDDDEEVIGTDPNDADTDDDGVRDGDEPAFAEDTDGDGLINALDPDSDNDALFDGTELGLDCTDPATDITAGHCVADADGGLTKTDPLDWDTDDGTVSDGSEDFNLDGKIDPGETNPTAGNGADDVAVTDTDGDGLSDELEDTIGTDPTDPDTDDDGVIDGQEPNPTDDTDGDGTINALDPDSDGDGLFDGTEMGKDCSAPATDPAAGTCVADGDMGATTTSPLDPDTDHGGVSDGDEDTNGNGVIDPGEIDPNDGSDDATKLDSDGDGLTDAEEMQIGTDPFDADSDDDGVSDGKEPSVGVDTDGDGLINGLDPDSDDDGIFDGTELGLDCSGPGTNPMAGNCIPDGDKGGTKTDPLDADTDDGGVSDGLEDKDKDGVVDAGETNPLDPADDKVVPNPCETDEDCGGPNSGQICVEGSCTEGCRGEGGNGCPTGEECTSTNTAPGLCVSPEEAIRLAGGGCACATGQTEGAPGGVALAFAALGALVLRRKRRA